MAYAIILEPDAMEHLRDLLARDRAVVLDAIHEQLVHTPTKKTRNRKELQASPLVRWELRVGAHRVFYDVVEGESTVRITAIGRKEHGRPVIGGREYRL